jgi:hypothetical protein
MRHLLVASLLLAGCYNPTFHDGALKCGPDTPRCPDGYHCAQDNTCWADGHNPTIQGEDAGEMGTDPNGTTCTAGNTCASGFCVDGVCCDRGCAGQCEACDVSGSPGICTPVSGPPHGTRAGCTGAGDTCGGTCDGANAASCSYAAASTICGAACDGHCNGGGTCSSSTGGTCPNGFACGTNACKTSCTVQGDCQTNFMCSGSSCVRIPESDCLDGLDNNGDGLIDCADPSCTMVQCVPSSASPVGTVETSCTGTITGTHINQGFSAPTSCHACGCSTAGTCSFSIYADNTGNGCVNANTLLGTFTAANTCIMVTPAGYYSMNAVGSANATCSALQTGMPDATTYSTSKSFCPSTKSSAASACPANQVCVPKPATGSICTLVNGTTCPSGYATNTGTWYGDGTTSDTRSCTCTGCTTTSMGSCNPAGLAYFVHTATGDTAPKCVDNPAPYNYSSGGCYPWNLPPTTNDYYWLHTSTVDALQLHALPSNTGSTCNGGTGTVTGGSATPGTTYTVCCP